MIPDLIAEASAFKRIELGDREKDFLTKIADGKNTAYLIHSDLKKRGISMDYKNVSKRVRRLHELKLITESKGESAHRAKFYKLSTEGLFYLLVNCPITPRMLIEYKDNIILKSLLYPYFEEKTVEIGGENYEIGQYLIECGHRILTYLDYLRRLADHPLKKVAKEKIIKQLQIDLEWQAKSLAFRILTKRTHLWDVVEPFFWPYTNLKEKLKHDPDFLNKQIPRASLLPTDRKFTAFAKNLRKEYEQAFSNMAESARDFE